MVHILDTRQLGRSGIIAATALETDEDIALFDTGPESTYENVIVDLREAGFAAKDVRHVFLSHIHFDHAGAAWRFAQPTSQGNAGATIYVHPRGAPHLIDPTKLISSATRIFGGDMERLWGRIAGVPSERVRIVEDNEIIHLPPFAIRAIATPGHASHHHVYHWDDTVFGGDIAGVSIGGGPPIPPFVPPELHVEAWLDSLARIRELDPANLYLPHFGKIDNQIAEHLNAVEERIRRWSEWFRHQIRAGADEEALRRDFTELEQRELRDAGATAKAVEDYEAADPSYMAVPAAIRYWNKYHPEAVGTSR